MTLNPSVLDRRAFLNACTRAGIASPLLPGILYTLAAQAQVGAGGEAKAPALAKITDEMLDRAAELAGVGPFTVEQKKMMLDGLNDQRDAYAQIRALKLTNDVPPAYVFHPGMAATYEPAKLCVDPKDKKWLDMIYCCGIRSIPDAPAHIEDLAFATIEQIAPLLRDKVITSLALTQMYIERL